MISRLIVCLAGCDDDIVPVVEEKTKLKANGIGESMIDFDADGSAKHVEEQILRYWKVKHLCVIVINYNIRNICKTRDYFAQYKHSLYMPRWTSVMK